MSSKLKSILFVGFVLSVAVLPTVSETLAESTQVSPSNIEFQCGQYKVAIACGKIFDPEYPQDKRQCNHNTLSFTGADGKVVVPVSPKGFDETKTPVSMACALGKDGRHYVVVEFNNGPRDCIQCLTYHLFASNGTRLTADMTDRMAQLASFRKKLNITDIQPIYIEGEGK